MLKCNTIPKKSFSTFPLPLVSTATLVGAIAFPAGSVAAQRPFSSGTLLPPMMMLFCRFRARPRKCVYLRWVSKVLWSILKATLQSLEPSTNRVAEAILRIPCVLIDALVRKVFFSSKIDIVKYIFENVEYAIQGRFNEDNAFPGVWNTRNTLRLFDNSECLFAVDKNLRELIQIHLHRLTLSSLLSTNKDWKAV